MNNLLNNAANNIFITSANIIDTITYKYSNPATNIVIPHNCDSLMAPMVDMLKKDFELYNQVLDDYNLELQDTEYILNHFKIKIKKEQDLRLKMEQRRQEQQRQAELKAKHQEEERLQKELKAKQDAESVSFQEKPQQQISNPDDMVLDLDLDNFNFDTTGADGLSFNFEPSMVSANELQKSQSPAQQQPQSRPQLQNQISQPQTNDFLTFDDSDQQEAADAGLGDLNLDFLDATNVDVGNADNLDLIGGLNSNNNNNNVNSSGGFEDDGSLMPTDQMEHLFSQFDELVGNHSGL